MKNQILKVSVLLTMVLLFTNNLSAQQMYASINAGYGLKMGTQSMFSDYNYNSTNGHSISTRKAIDVSFGKGFCFGAAFGYMLTKNIGGELNVSYLVGGKTKSKFSSTTVETGLTTTFRTSDESVSANMFRIIPTIVIAAGLEKFDPYAKLGLIIGMGSMKFENNVNDNGDVSVTKNKMYGGVALGLSSAMGVKYNINDMMSVFAELNMVSLSYAPKKGKTTEYKINGIDQLPTMTTNEKETKFVKETTSDSSSPILASEPSESTRQKWPFSSLGLNLGFRINF